MRVSIRNPAAEPNHQAVGTVDMPFVPEVGDVIDIAGVRGGPYVVDRRIWRALDRVILQCSRC